MITSSVDQLYICRLCGNSNFHQLYKPRSIVRCDGCGLRSVFPLPATIDAITYTNQYYDSFAGEEVGLREMWNRRLRIVLGYVKTGSLLDVGAGTGMFLSLAAGYFQVAGTEISPHAAAQIQNRYHLQVLLTKADDIKGQNLYDCITLWHVLEHTPDPLLTLQSMCRLLKEGGYLFLALPNDDSFKQKIKRMLGYKTLYFDATPSREHHLYFFTRETILKLILKAHFYTVAVLADDYYPQRDHLNHLKFALSKFFTEIIPLHMASALMVVARKETYGHRD